MRRERGRGGKIAKIGTCIHKQCGYLNEKQNYPNETTTIVTIHDIINTCTLV